MTAVHPVDLPLAEARALVRRAVDKAEQLGLRGAIAVVGASGALVTASRLDHGGPGGMCRARSKAWISATQQIPSAEHLHRMTTLPAPISRGFVTASPEALFPGAGGLPIRAGEVVVGGISASGATVSPFLPAGVAPEAVSAEGEPANPEDLLLAYALSTPYAGQHGDDRSRWQARFGDLTVPPDRSLGLKPAPPAVRQSELDWAVAVCDRVLVAAAGAGLRVSVAVVDRGGDPIQQDRMDHAVAGGVDVALATASAAARFGVPSDQLADWYPAAQLAALHPAPLLAAPGGLPIVLDGRVVGGLGIGGADPATCATLARAAL
ncbi:heme-binding protein [Actinoplanes sp. KI2]|uniref:GlcG/HbpS family heme-binding protein n=1 Tax=Actinoplanes sp. KI2 TaxID=2983315 RepID=UPI0021D5DFCF|nr:heme-binding protein [Actinoplanes sp. KI2]MCU7729238.1 heme-binding protein [Actinoplanes sp. KI2]